MREAFFIPCRASGGGALLGRTGVGGGSLMTPLLVLLFGIHPITAVGTDLLYAATTKSVGTLFHGFNRTVEWRLTGLLAAGSLPVAALTVIGFVGPARDDPQVAALVRTTLGLALLLTAAMLVLRRPLLAAVERRRPRRNASLRPRSCDALTVAGNWYFEGVDFLMLGSLLLASIPGILIGSLLSPRMPTMSCG